MEGGPKLPEPQNQLIRNDPLTIFWVWNRVCAQILFDLIPTHKVLQIFVSPPFLMADLHDKFLPNTHKFNFLQAQLSSQIQTVLAVSQTIWPPGCGHVPAVHVFVEMQCR